MPLLSPLNAILDVDVAARAGWTPLDVASVYLSGGARFLQIRAKALSGAAFLELSLRVCELAHAAGAIVVINDRADVARLSGADGLHVGQDDLTPSAARVLLGADALLGLSTHTEAQIDAAMEQPITDVAVGPVFQTATKATGYTAVGLDRVRYAAKLDRAAVGSASRPARPVVAIGGITLENASSALDAGATSVAVISDLLATGNPEARVRTYLAKLAERGAGRAKV